MPRKKKQHLAATRYWIGYCRKSTDTEDKQVYTLQDQAVMIREYYEQLPAVERAYPLRLLQEAQSAYHPGRPIFRSILEMASSGEVYGVIVVHPNRISRNHADSGAFVQRLVDRAILQLDTTSGKRYTGADSNDIFMLTLEGAMSWKDSRDKGDRIRQAMRMRAAEGKHMGPVHLGYRIVYRPDGTRVLEVVPEIAPLVRRMYELAATGVYSTQDLALEARKMGLRSRLGRRLGKSSVNALLRAPLYKGYIHFDGIVARGVHEPIVDEDLWNRVQLAISGRTKGTARPMDLELRDLFVFGKLLHCPRCGRSLCPYRAKGVYVYYECKNPETSCGVCVAQAALDDQIAPLLSGAFLSSEELSALREGLIRHTLHQNAEGVSQRRTLTAEYEKVQREIGEIFSQRQTAAALGILSEVDMRLQDLGKKRDEVRAQLNASHVSGAAFVERVIRAFELVNLLEEAIFCGSRQAREMTLKAIASNFFVEDKKLRLKLRSPFQESAQKQDCPIWWAGLYDVRTDIFETVERLEAAYTALQLRF